MGLLKPSIYKPSIFDINYKTLQNNGIKCLIFDLDNTLSIVHKKEVTKEVKDLIKELQKDFLILISSNNLKMILKPFLKELEIEGVSLSMKPSTIALQKIRKKYKLHKKEMCIIGDQLLTDILAGNRYHITTILVDPLGEKDLNITKINRKLEKIITKKYQKKGIFERGKYYE